MRYVYGPVPSRRLGRSLGIDPIPPKTCNWNCVYCQLGRTSSMTAVRREYYPSDAIVAQLRAALEDRAPSEIDWLTFVGSGEPTLHIGLGRMIRRVKNLTDIPVAVITNGALLHRADVREELAAADAVLPSLDAGSQRLYRRINRPLAFPDLECILEGLAAFRGGYAGKLWVEVMLVKGLNDDDEALHDLAAALRRFQPDEVHVSLPVRPPAESWVEPPDAEGLMRATVILSEVARLVHPVHGEFELSGDLDVVDAVLAVITRHPMREEELTRTLHRWVPGRVDAALAELHASGRVRTVTRLGHRFWSAAEAKYARDAEIRSAGGR
jgi:wyosine [tRNA(Phe)-imidazoG37] synthetase (radical SAM superfamily)